MSITARTTKEGPALPTSGEIRVKIPPGSQVRKVVFYFEPPTRAYAGFEVKKITESEKNDPEYVALRTSLALAVNQIVKHNLADGKDRINDPAELIQALDEFRARTLALYLEKGQKQAFAILRSTKEEIFAETSFLHNTTPPEHAIIANILRWHVQDEIDHQPAEA